MQTFWYRRLLTRDSKMLTNIEAEDKDNAKDKDKEVNVRLCSIRLNPAVMLLHRVMSTTLKCYCGMTALPRIYSRTMR